MLAGSIAALLVTCSSAAPARTGRGRLPRVGGLDDGCGGCSSHRWLVGTLALDSGGYVLTGSDAARAANGQFDELGRTPLMLETTEPGVSRNDQVQAANPSRVRLNGCRGCARIRPWAGAQSLRSAGAGGERVAVAECATRRGDHSVGQV